jgi:single-strand DNA-binding protein
MSLFSINRVVLVGRLTRDPEMRALPSGVSVCGLRIACNTGKKDAAGGAQEKPNFFDVNVFGAAGEGLGRHIRKGSRVGVDGRLDWHEWVNAKDERRQAVAIVADTVQLLDSPGGRGRDPGADMDFDGDRGSEEYEDHRDPQDEDLELAGIGMGADGEDLAF